MHAEMYWVISWNDSCPSTAVLMRVLCASMIQESKNIGQLLEMTSFSVTICHGIHAWIEIDLCTSYLGKLSSRNQTGKVALLPEGQRIARQEKKRAQMLVVPSSFSSVHMTRKPKV